MTVRSALAIGGLASVMASCTPSYVVVPSAGGNVAAAAAGGVSMAAYPETWQGYPEDLSEYLTPIWISIVNQTPHRVRVRYRDFVLTDASGFRYAAISPYSGQPQLSTRPASPEPASKASHAAPSTTPRPSTPAAPAPATEEPAPAEAPPPAGDDTQPETRARAWRAQVMFASYVPRGGRSHPRPGLRPVPYRGYRPGRFHGNPHLYTHVVIGPGPYYYGPWPYGWGPYPYYYGPYVYSWDYGYYPGAPSADILRLGLPEGELLPGGRVSGFIYFQQAARQPGRLDLTWNVHGTQGRAIASVTSQMRVVSD